jgi:nickel-dependent lactate racemase
VWCGQTVRVNIALPYGTTTLSASVPDDATVVVGADLPGLTDETRAVADALRAPVAGAPLRALIPGGARVVVVFPDITRPMPNRTVLPPLLTEIESCGISPDDIVLLCATGTHRAANPTELRDLVGPDVLSRYRVKNHVATDGDHVEVGRIDRVPVLLDRDYVQAGVRVVTGFVEPHFFAGFSGGPKAVCPGLAALETILEAHSPARIADPRATWTITEGNPVHDFVRAATALLPPTFSVDVAINGRRQLTAVFAGSLDETHRAACEFVGRTAVQQVPGRFDVVVSTNSGHPLDRNLYQAVKGMAAAERIVRPGGRIVMVAACADGIPDEGDFGNLLAAASSPADLVDAAQPKGIDRWEAQVLGRVLQHASVALYSDGLSDSQIRTAHLDPVDDISDAIAAATVAAGPRVGVLPLGPLTVATAGGDDS